MAECTPDGAAMFVNALRIFDSNHHQRVRMEGSQRTSLENLSSTLDALRTFNAQSDTVYSHSSDAFAQHIQLLSKIRQEVLLLEARVTKAKERAIFLAENDGIDLSFLDDPK